MKSRPVKITAAISMIIFSVMIAVHVPLCKAFVVAPNRSPQLMQRHSGSCIVANVFGKKGPKEDLSFIESRDMTRQEMLELNKKNEEIMNMELQMMTGFSLVLSLPLLYLCWVAFFSD